MPIVYRFFLPRHCLRAFALATFAAAAISSVPALAAAPQYCVLWAREDVRITLLTTHDVDLITAAPELIRRMFDRRYAWCVAQKAEHLGLPGGDKRLTDAWVAFMAERIIGKRRPDPVDDVPETVVDASEPEPVEDAANPPEGDQVEVADEAGDPMSISGFPIGSSEHLAWCRDEYLTWNEETRTVIRQGSNGRRVPCP